MCIKEFETRIQKEILLDTFSRTSIPLSLSLSLSLYALTYFYSSIHLMDYVTQFKAISEKILELLTELNQKSCESEKCIEKKLP